MKFNAATDMDTLTKRVVDLYQSKKSANNLESTANDSSQQINSQIHRVLIAVAGVPGSGKSTLTAKISQNLCTTANLKTVVLPQDGFHYYRRELAQMDDPDIAFERRGAPFTFNVESFVDVVEKVKYADTTTTVYAPSFSHALKDPIANDIAISPDVKVVFIEGNYVLLEDPIWSDIQNYVDETWYIEGDQNLINQRVIKRHLEAGIAQNEQEAKARALGSDQLNAQYIRNHSVKPDVVIEN